jgi:UDP-4-amino-4,6-dideoxy-N-acetyl-beta-L-altrosamine N-acetyltransferase
MYTDDLITPEHQLGWFCRQVDDPTTLVFLVEFDGRPIGVVNFKELDRPTKGCLWGFYIGATDVPKGTGLRLGYAAIEFAFNELKLGRIRGEVFDFNHKSINLHRRLGFQESGVVRGGRIKNGVRRDIILFSLDSDTWHRRKADLEHSLHEAKKHGT